MNAHVLTETSKLQDVLIQNLSGITVPVAISQGIKPQVTSGRWNLKLLPQG
jgi:hypothetical protein